MEAKLQTGTIVIVTYQAVIDFSVFFRSVRVAGRSLLFTYVLALPIKSFGMLYANILLLVVTVGGTEIIDSEKILGKNKLG